MKACVAFASLFAVSMAVAGTSPAWAASPAYCALYAREYAAARIGPVTDDQSEGAAKRVEDQAYFRCLNLDDEPEFPSSSAYAGASVEDLDGGAKGPFQDIAEGDAADDSDQTDVTTTAALPAPKPPAAVATAAAGAAYASGTKLKGTGLIAWSAAWMDWCKSHFPHSFDAKTGYVVPVGEPKRFCGA